MVSSLLVLPCESSVSVKENPNIKKTVKCDGKDGSDGRDVRGEW